MSDYNVVFSMNRLCLISIPCLRKKSPFYFCDIFVRCHPILLIFERNISPENLQHASDYLLVKNWQFLSVKDQLKSCSVADDALAEA